MHANIKNYAGRALSFDGTMFLFSVRKSILQCSEMNGQQTSCSFNRNFISGRIIQ
jgi:hypothetical protein